MSGPDLGWWRAVALICATGFAALALFVAWPELDLAAAALFFEDRRFPLGDGALARGLRVAYRWAFVAGCVAAALGLSGRLARGAAAARVPAALWLYPVALFALGPGLLVNALLKAHWGRARPAQVEAFGGGAEFSGPFEIVAECASNCSFVSGEGSAAAALAVALIGLSWGRLGAAGRAAAGAATALWLIGAAFIRMAPGRHFLSDTLFAFVLMALLGAILYRALGVGRRREAVAPGAYAHDLAAAPFALARAARGAVRRRRAAR